MIRAGVMLILLYAVLAVLLDSQVVAAAITIPAGLLTFYSFRTGALVATCPHCGKAVKLGRTVCHHCGRDVTSGS